MRRRRRCQYVSRRERWHREKCRDEWKAQNTSETARNDFEIDGRAPTNATASAVTLTIRLPGEGKRRNLGSPRPRRRAANSPESERGKQSQRSISTAVLVVQVFLSGVVVVVVQRQGGPFMRLHKSSQKPPAARVASPKVIYLRERGGKEGGGDRGRGPRPARGERRGARVRLRGASRVHSEVIAAQP